MNWLRLTIAAILAWFMMGYVVHRTGVGGGGGSSGGAFMVVIGNL